MGAGDAPIAVSGLIGNPDAGGINFTDLVEIFGTLNAAIATAQGQIYISPFNGVATAQTISMVPQIASKYPCGKRCIARVTGYYLRPNALGLPSQYQPLFNAVRVLKPPMRWLWYLGRQTEYAVQWWYNPPQDNLNRYVPGIRIGPIIGQPPAPKPPPAPPPPGEHYFACNCAGTNYWFTSSNPSAEDQAFCVVYCQSIAAGKKPPKPRKQCSCA